ncbi:hypothetical protein ACH5RR_034059 [Cinchona calisaya]|uniref:Uncharacterized protein n=1 Tax=Cinchona calisaya TaxID=153742 RepID=A0ABD2YB44_9GENT
MQYYDKDFVRGKSVDIFGNTINRLLQVSRIRNDEWSMIRDNNMELNDIMNLIGTGDVEWTKDVGGVARHFGANKLKPVWFVWFKFICARFLPVSHLTHVTLE